VGLPRVILLFFPKWKLIDILFIKYVRPISSSEEDLGLIRSFFASWQREIANIA
jgi:hypothetical protein